LWYPTSSCIPAFDHLWDQVSITTPVDNSYLADTVLLLRYVVAQGSAR
jgi:hypothetical protein